MSGLTPVAQTVTEVIGDRVVTIAQIVAFCYCWRQAVDYFKQWPIQKRPARPEMADAVDEPGAHA